MSEDRPFSFLMEDLRRGDSNAAREVFERFTRRLVGLAAARLPPVLKSKIDPEDVAQSVLRTFFRRHRAGEFQPEHWDALWSLLAVLAARKCGHQVEHLLAAKRDARREVSPPNPAGDSVAVWEPVEHAPTPSEALIFEETLAQLLTGLKDRERTIVLLRLQGHSISEVAEQAEASERSVHRILAGVRIKLESLASE